MTEKLHGWVGVAPAATRGSAQAALDHLEKRCLSASRVHLTANVPVAQTMLVGATLTNGPEVVIHHFTGGLALGRLSVDRVRR